MIPGRPGFSADEVPTRTEAGPAELERAAEWFGRREVGLSAEEATAFVRWLQDDARNFQAYREIDQTWRRLDGLKDIEQRMSVAQRHDADGWNVFPLLRHRLVFPVSLAAAAIAFAFVAFRPQPAQAPIVQRASTEAGGMHKMELPDRSVVHLNASSAVTVHFTSAERRVALVRGEAYFTVVKDPARPFVVNAGGVSVQAVGTAFNVRLAADTVAVFVTEGKVSVAPAVLERAEGNGWLAGSAGDPEGRAQAVPFEPPLLTAGQRAIISLTDAATPAPVVVEPMAREEMERALSWQARMLEFDLTPLVDVVAQFNRYNQHQLVIADRELAQRPFGGTFRADNYEVFVRLLETRFGVVAKRSGDRTVLRRATAPPGRD